MVIIGIKACLMIPWKFKNRYITRLCLTHSTECSELLVKIRQRLYTVNQSVHCERSRSKNVHLVHP